MKYLKKFKRINESSNEECDFQTFKDILSDFSDDFRCTFEDYSNLSE